MATTVTIDDLIADHLESLSLSWLTPLHRVTLSETPNAPYWIGEYHPELQHGIEIIHSGNYTTFSQCLAHDHCYLDSGLENTHPILVIFTENVKVHPAIRPALQAKGIAALQTPHSPTKILRELAYTLAQQGKHLNGHGVLLSIHNHGVLLTGESGIGKSAVALELITRGHRLVADDAPLLHRLPAGSQIYGVCPPLLADFLDVRILGILNVSKLYGSGTCMAITPVQLVIELVDSVSLTPNQRLQPYAEQTSILGVDIPYLQIPVGHATNLAVLVETAALNHVLYEEGYDASASLAHRQLQHMNKQPV